MANRETKQGSHFRAALLNRLKKTGQETDYTPAGYTSKDDGVLQKGVGRRYQVLTTGQFSGTTSITVNAKTDVHSNECVLDLVTGLMFSRTLSASVGPASDGKLKWDDTGGVNEDVFAYCDQANIAALSGFSDWYVANLNQLVSLYNFGDVAGMQPDTTAFPTIGTTPIWSSSTYYSLTTAAHHTFTTVFRLSSAAAKTTSNFNVLLCRGG